MQSILGIVVLCTFCLLVHAGDSNSNNTIRLMILTHSHDDVGWTSTPQEYYDKYIRLVYDTVVPAMLANPKHKFIAVEMYYFSKWWNHVSFFEQASVRQLLKNGQMEFVSGGWAIHDEATTTYSANIDQMTEGHLFLHDNFGVTPKFGWQIDPFGASGITHAHFAMMNFDATVTCRINSWTKNQWQIDNDMQFIWKPSESYEGTQIWTHILDQYRYKPGFSGLRWSFGDPPVNSSNIYTLATEIQQNAIQRSTWFRPITQGSDSQPVVLFPWGSDFDHYKAIDDFYNMDQLVEYLNLNQSFDIKAEYVTLSDYFKTIHDADMTWNTYGPNDFLSYADNAISFWTGYYTSRPALKGYARSRENFLKTAELLYTLNSLALGNQNSDQWKNLQELREICAVVTHHDAITGTSNPDVNAWYAAELRQATQSASEVITGVLQNMVDHSTIPLTLELNVTSQLTSDNAIEGKHLDNIIDRSVVVYNPLGWVVDRFVSVPVYSDQAAVWVANDGDLLPIGSQVINAPPSQPGPCQVDDTCGYSTGAPFELFFMVKLPPLGYATYYITTSSSSVTPVMKVLEEDSMMLENDVLQLFFDEITGQITAINNKQSGVSIDISQNFFQYTGQTNCSLQCAGAYIMQPIDDAQVIQEVPDHFEIVNGEYVKELRQFYTNVCPEEDIYANRSDLPEQTCGLLQIFRLYAGIVDMETFVEVIHNYGPLQANTDLITRYSTSLQNEGVFSTDDNCLEMKQRTFNDTCSNIYACNYYPVTCGLSIENQDSSDPIQFAILTDRSRGGSSVHYGQAEVMLHRRMMVSDGRGPMALDDTDRLENSKIYLLVDRKSVATDLRHHLQYLQAFPPTLVLRVVNQPDTSGTNQIYSPLLQEFPKSVHVMSFRYPYATSSDIILRLVNIYQKGDLSAAGLAQSVTVDLTKYFADVSTISERTLNAVWPISSSKNRWSWTSNNSTQPPDLADPIEASNSVYHIDPLHIKTFYLTFQ